MADLFGTNTEVTASSVGGVNAQVSGRAPSTGADLAKGVSALVDSLTSKDDGVARLGETLKSTYDKLDSDLKTGAITSVEYNRRRREAYQNARVRAGSVPGAKSMVDDLTEASQVEYKVTDAGVQEVNKATGEIIGFQPDASTPDAVVEEHTINTFAEYEANYESSSITGQNLAMKLGAEDTSAYATSLDIASTRNQFASSVSAASRDIAVKARVLPAEELTKYKTKKSSALKDQLTEGFFGLSDTKVLEGVKLGKITPEEVLSDLDANYADVSKLLKDSGADSYVSQNDVRELYKSARADLKVALESAANGEVEAAKRDAEFARLNYEYKKYRGLGELPSGFWKESEQLKAASDAITVAVDASRSEGLPMDVQGRIGDIRKRALTMFDMVSGKAEIDSGAAKIYTADQKWKALSTTLDTMVAKANSSKDVRDAADKSKAEFQASGNLFESIDNVAEITQAASIFKEAISSRATSLVYKDEIISLFENQILPSIQKFKTVATTESTRNRLEEQEREYSRQFDAWKRDVEAMESGLYDKDSPKKLKNNSIYSGR